MGLWNWDYEVIDHGTMGNHRDCRKLQGLQKIRVCVCALVPVIAILKAVSDRLHQPQ